MEKKPSAEQAVREIRHKTRPSRSRPDALDKVDEDGIASGARASSYPRTRTIHAKILEQLEARDGER